MRDALCAGGRVRLHVTSAANAPTTRSAARMPTTVRSRFRPLRVAAGGGVGWLIMSQCTVPAGTLRGGGAPRVLRYNRLHSPTVPFLEVHPSCASLSAAITPASSRRSIVKKHLVERGARRRRRRHVLARSRSTTPTSRLAVARAVATGDADLGVLVCGTGIGMAIAANKVIGVRAANVTDAGVRAAGSRSTTTPTS